MGQVLGKGRKEKKNEATKATEEERAEQKLKTVKRKLESYKTRVEYNKHSLGREALRKKQNNEMDAAIKLLHRKKLHDGMQERIDGQLFAVEQSLLNLQESVRTRVAFDAIAMGNDALKRLTDAVPLEALEKLNEEHSEAKEHVQHVSEMLGLSDAPVVSQFELDATFGDLAQQYGYELPEKTTAHESHSGVTTAHSVENAEEDIQSQMSAGSALYTPSENKQALSTARQRRKAVEEHEVEQASNESEKEELLEAA